MSKLKLDNLTPAPFFARFLEPQFKQELSPEEQARIRGGSGTVTTMALSDSHPVPPSLPGQGGQWSLEELIKFAHEGVPGSGAPYPGGPSGPIVTMAHPSDSPIVPFL